MVHHRSECRSRRLLQLASSIALLLLLVRQGQALATEGPVEADGAQPSAEGAGTEPQRSADHASSSFDFAASSQPQSATASSRRTPTSKQADSTPKTAKHLPKPDESTSSVSTATTQTQSTNENAPMAPIALPTGGDKSGVTTKTVSLPKGAGSIEGMGESFSAQLSTGIATFSVPFALPKARGAAQPSLGLSYSSGSGQGVAGLGWSVGVPFIARQTDRGLPKYNEESDWQPEQDRFVYNGGQELVPICLVSAEFTCSASMEQHVSLANGSGFTLSERMPAWAAGWQYFRPRVEGSFLRFFWSPDHLTWRVQDKNGVTLELGVPRDDTSYTTALEQNPDPTNAAKQEIYCWHLVRQFDAQVSSDAAGGDAPVNMVAYRYAQSGGQSLLTDIYDTPAATANSGLAGYAHHVHLRYETRTDPTVSYRSGWAIEQTQRLIGVDVTSKTFEVATDTRTVVRRYHLSYATGWHQSLLESVQIEGRCGDNGELGADGEGSDGSLPVTACPRLPAMSFAYQHVEPFTTDGKAGAADLDGYEGFDERIQVMAQSPKHSLDEQLTDLFDVNSDGLPDVLVTAPGLYGPGHGVFFNGTNGARGFGGVTQMGIAGVNGADASTITLRNLNVAALDLDGDGRVNLLHMPRVKTYAVYNAVQSAGNWKWSGDSVTTATRQDPKIDFGKDTLEIQVADVNFDGLVDVVYGSGTELQTFFSLGRYPGGDKQFGQAHYTSAISSRISNDPVTTCVPYAGLPIRFSDKETKLADMNGDGIVDIVKLQRGQIRYWPGRGNAFFGTGRRDDCKAGSFGANRYLEMSQSPQYSDIEGDSLRLDDVNGDGLSDLVQVRFDAVDVWLNVDGKGWTTRHIIDGSPYSPSYAQRVRLTDINGSGTPDILWGNAEKFQYIDLTGGKKPGVLVQVSNGLGKTTTIEYATSTEQMLAAEGQATCPESGIAAGSDPWAHAWCKKMPTVAHVVSRVTESDNLVAAGQGPSKIVTEYDYRDPVYEGRQREFRGFERVRVRRLGDANSPTDVSESGFLLGECLDLTNDGTDDCSLAERWRDNPMEALKGLPFVSEKRDLSGRTLSTDVTNYELRKLYDGRDGRAVSHAVAVATTSYAYDTSAAFTGGGSGTPAVVQFVKLGTGASTQPEASNPLTVISKPIATRSSAYATLQAASGVDFFGNQYLSTKFGCIANCADSAAGLAIQADEVIASYTIPAAVPLNTSGWMFRTVESWTEGSLHGVNRYGYQKRTYDPQGNPTRVEAELVGSVGLTRSAGLGDGLFVASETVYDDYGNPTRVTGANDRCSTLDYDPVYAQLPVKETVYRSAGCQDGLSVTASPYDRGLGLVLVARDMNDQPTRVAYDGFGRTRALYKPLPDSNAISSVPSVQIEYFLPPTLGSNISAIRTQTEDGAAVGEPGALETWAFVDGFGRTRTTLSEADKTNGDEGAWVVSGLVSHDAKGAVQRKHVEYFYDGAPEAFPIASAPGTPYGSQRYDAFGRAVQTFDLDGTLTLKTVYHALGTDLWDAADLSTGPHASTYASERKDGHGRTLRVTERAHSGNTVQTRHVITEYSPTGQPEVLTRRLGSNAAKDVVRWMRYDSLGRMVLNVDPHTSTGDLTVPDPATTLADYERPDDLKAWAYLYNYAGDLIGTEDARGCGVNFGYDALGRLLGEDYVPCESTHQAYSTPNDARTEGWEVVYYYDGPPPNGDQVPAELGTHRYNKGRLVAVRDRAAETTTFVDGRGRVISTVRRVGSPADANEVVDNKIANRYTAQWFYKREAYDAADRVVAESVGGQHTNPRTAFDGAAASVFGSDAQDKQVVRTHYTARGTIQGIDGSYGTLVRKLTRRADGLVTNLVYGDSACTQTSTTYDDRRRPVSIQTYRADSPLWSAFATGGGGVQNVTYSPTPSLAGTSTTFQMLLEDTDLAYDEVGNPVEIRDWREASEWPASSKPVTKKIEYDDLYRVRRMDYLYSTASGTDTWTSPFDKENTEADADRDIRRAKPVPQLSFSKRPVWQRFEYDWLGNLSESDDDAHGIYDRSLGTQEHKNTGKPYQLTRGSNATQAASGGFSGNVTAVYDAAGNMTRLSVVRPSTTGACVPSGVGCTQYYAYNWDEVGRLVRAQRWDSTSQSQLATDPVPTTTASFELRYRYDASDQRVIKRLYRSSMASQRQSLYLFGSLEVHRTAYSGSTYTIDEKTLVPYLMSNGVRLARLHYENAVTVPQVAGTGLTDALGKTNTAATLHVLLELGDHLGSTGTVLDKVSSELVERTGYLPFGARENDYRPSRWNGFREDYGFTGKEEDVQVGLVYFGKRYLSPQLGRWLSADPLAIHAPGRADFNLYAYVSGAVLKSVDPVGLADAEQNRINDILDGDLEKSSVPQVQALAEDKDRAAASLKSWAAPAPTEQESKAIKAYFAEAHAQDAEMANRGKYTQLPTVDDLHTALDVASLALEPTPVGWAPDVVNAGAYAWQGKPVEAVVSFGAAVPIAGALVAGAVKQALSHADEAADIAKGVEKAARGGPKPLKEQAADLVPFNGGKSRVTLDSPSQRMEVDLTGKAHAGVDTPHVKVSPRNTQAPEHAQPAYNTRKADTVGATQQDIRTVRRYLERQGN